VKPRLNFCALLFSAWALAILADSHQKKLY
jgi:hypothetical protein